MKPRRYTLPSVGPAAPPAPWVPGAPGLPPSGGTTEIRGSYAAYRQGKKNQEIGGRYPAIDYSDWSETNSKKAVTNTDMYVRNAPDKNGAALGVVRGGTEVTVLEQLDNGWLKIVWGNSCKRRVLHA